MGQDLATSSGLRASQSTTMNLKFSTNDVSVLDRAPQWCEWVHQHFGGLQSDLYGDVNFDGQLVASMAGDVLLTRLEAGRHRVLRTPQMARSSQQSYLKIIVPWQGYAVVHQQSRHAVVREGGWIMYDTTDHYAIDNPQRVDHLVVMVPQDGTVDRSLRLPHLMARPLGDCGIARVALETMRHTYRELPHMSPEVARGAGETIKQLVRLSLQELAGQESAVTQRQALADRIRQYVGHHLGDPALTVDAIATALNCSRRLLYTAFEGDSESIAAYIQRMRLEACVRDLQQAGPHARPITDIALSWGFANPSHFSRVFRAQKGESPTEFRRGQLSN